MDKIDQDSLIDETSASKVIQAIKPYLTQKRQARIESVLENRIDSITIAMESPSDPHNAFAVIRSAEALGLTAVHIITPEGDGNISQAITQGAHHWIDVFFYTTIESFFERMQSENRQIVGGTVDSGNDISTLSVDQPLCLLLGNEQRGLSNTAKTSCKQRYTLPLYGMTESYNLSVSAALSLYATCQKKRKLAGQSGDLTTQACERLQARYYLNSVTPRLAHALLKNTA